ncbi:ribosomal RNA assembly protein krr1 [Epichloe bromicola]|uniref:Ribosomal RNA assembly protein krr1 n=1 Tax=Epichloe bromicola TaxID=79588 RepID=A0ABQ0CV94_9HYPO
MSSPSPTYEQEQFCDGLELILDYLNAGNTYYELLHVKNRANLWCKEYFSSSIFTAGHPDELLRIYPSIFDLGIPSWKRLNPKEPQDKDKDVDMDKNSTDDQDEGDDVPMKFPGYSEPTLLDDTEAFSAADMLEAQQADRMEDDEDDDYAGLREPLRVRHVNRSPLISHVPEIMIHLALVDPDKGMESSVFENMMPGLTNKDSTMENSPPPPQPPQPPSPSMAMVDGEILSGHCSGDSSKTQSFDAMEASPVLKTSEDNEDVDMTGKTQKSGEMQGVVGEEEAAETKSEWSFQRDGTLIIWRLYGRTQL